MKSIVLTCAVLFTIASAHAQLKPLTYSAAVKAEGVTGKDLYKKGKNWYNEIFQCSSRVLTQDDAIQGVISSKCSFPYTSKVMINSAKTKGEVRYQIKLRFTDGRYQCEITDFRHTGFGISFDLLTQEATCAKDIPGATPEWKNEVWNDMKAQAKAHADSIIKSMIAEISKPNR